MTTKAEMKAKPYLENYPPLRDWLRKHDARCNWQVALGNGPDGPRAYIESWQSRAWRGDVIVVVRADQLGWDIYTSCSSNDIDASLADALARVIVTP